MKETFGAIPNFLGEGFAEAMEQQCISLFVAVAVEKDPVKRFALVMRRENLLAELSRLRNDRAKAAQHIIHCPPASASAANSPRRAWEVTTAPGAKKPCAESCWYCRAPEGDTLRDAIDTLALRCVAVAKEHGRDCRDIFAAALYRALRKLRISDVSPTCWTRIPTSSTRSSSTARCPGLCII